MTSALRAFCTALCVFCAALFASCPDGGGETVYTVTVSQPASGGEIAANPTSGAAGITITLSNSPNDGYTFSHYTVDGERNDSGAFTLSGDTTVSGVFATNSGTYTVTVGQSQPANGGAITANPTSGAKGTPITLSNSPNDGYTFSHYTVGGAQMSGDTFALNDSVTVSGVFKYTGDGFTVTVGQSQPANGGAINASPMSGPAGTSVTLSNTPASGYTFSHYTVNGAQISGDTFTLNDNATVSGVFTQDGASPVQIQKLGGGSSAVLTVPAGGGAAATLEIGSASAPYADPAAPAAFALPQDARDALADAGSIAVSFKSSTPATVSLAYAHYVREALKGAKTGIVITAVTADPDTFTPVFDGRDWWTRNSSSDYTDLYSAYPIDSDTQLMNGIKISKSSPDNKYVIVYDRALAVSRPVWQEDDRNSEHPFHGFGLKKGSGSVSIPDNTSVLGGYAYEDMNPAYYPVVADFAYYESALKEAGLHPSQGVLLNHSRAKVESPGSNANIAANGMYEFILAYYNPGKEYNAADYETKDEYNRITYTDGRALLPRWPATGLTFDGLELPAGVASRDIGGTTADSMSRKGARQTSGAPGFYATQGGEPRDDFVGNITVPMANYLKSSAHVSGFKNTNIIGDGDKWDSSGIVNNYLTLLPTDNVGLIGYYSSLTGLSSSFSGITDISGSLPESIGQNARKGYLNIWNNISRETGIVRFNVVYAHGSGGEKILTGSISDPTIANLVIIYSQKYNTANAVHSLPYYRAFLDGTTPKIIPAGTTTPAIDAAYKGTDTTGAQQVPSLDEAGWLIYMNANNGAEPPLQNYADAPKWDAADFNALPVATAAPQSLDTRLADAAHSKIEAVIPSLPQRKKRQA